MSLKSLFSEKTPNEYEKSSLGFSDYHSILARLYTDDFFRSIFFKNPNLALKGLELSDQEKNSLKKLDFSAVSSFSKQLKSKAERFIYTVFPNAYKHFRDEMKIAFNKGYTLIPKTPQDTLPVYGARFGYYFLKVLPLMKVPPYCLDLITYYIARLESKINSLPGFKIKSSLPHKEKVPFLYPNLKLYSFSYDIFSLIDENKTQQELSQLKKGCYHYLIYYVEENYQIISFSSSSAMLLELCNGVYNLEEIYQKLNSHFTLSFRDFCEKFIPKLIEERLVYIL